MLGSRSPSRYVPAAPSCSSWLAAQAAALKGRYLYSLEHNLKRFQRIQRAGSTEPAGFHYEPPGMGLMKCIPILQDGVPSPFQQGVCGEAVPFVAVNAWCGG